MLVVADIISVNKTESISYKNNAFQRKKTLFWYEAILKPNIWGSWVTNIKDITARWQVPRLSSFWIMSERIFPKEFYFTAKDLTITNVKNYRLLFYLQYTVTIKYRLNVFTFIRDLLIKLIKQCHFNLLVFSLKYNIIFCITKLI